jgi:hypothetical protein
MLYGRESAKLVSGTLASTTTLQSRVGTRCGRASGARNPLNPHSVAHKVHGRETPRGLSVVGRAVYDLFDHHHAPVIEQMVT